MTPADLFERMRERGWQLEDQDPAQIVRMLEQEADAQPDDLDLRQMLVEAHTMCLVPGTLETVIHGIRRTELIRWDAWSMTWAGHEVSTGRPARLRVLRDPMTQDPVARRALSRDGSLLAPLVSGLRQEDDALVVVATHSPTPVPPLTTWTRALDLMKRWSEAGLGLPLPLDTTLCHTGQDLEVLCLSPARPLSTSETLQQLADWLARILAPEEDSPALRLVQRFALLPPPSLVEVETQFRKTLREDLVARWHSLRIRHDALQHHDRKARLEELIHRLGTALPPPSGKAAVGMSMEGVTTVVQGDGQRLDWGEDGALDVVYDPQDGLVAQTARRLVRARAAAPPSLLLQDQVGGDVVFLDHASRWVASRLRLRTLRLLLKPRDREAASPAQ